MGIIEFGADGPNEAIHEDAGAECEAEARREVSPNIVSETVQQPDAPRRQVCHGGPATCTWVGGYSLPARTETHDANLQERGRVFVRCMRQGGWTMILG